MLPCLGRERVPFKVVVVWRRRRKRMDVGMGPKVDRRIVVMFWVRSVLGSSLYPCG
jgi:hypothetical protein